MAAADTRSQSAAELSRLMESSSKLSRRSASGRRFIGPLVAAALLVGVALGFATRPRSYLAGSPVVHVQERESPLAQLFHAKMAPSEAAWMAVWEMHPTADPYIHDLAREGLVRFYLFTTQDYAKALPYLRQLADSAGAAEQNSPLRAFAYAGLCVVNQRLNRLQEASEAYAQLTIEMMDTLRRSDDAMYRLLQSSRPVIGT
jgi:hypothetical protein